MKPLDKIKVSNIFGQLITEIEPNEIEFEINLKNVGVYFINVTSENKSKTTKIIVTN